MERRWLWVLLAAMPAWQCFTPVAELGAHDASVEVSDAGISPDAGPPRDAGPRPVDAGVVPVEDAGCIPYSCAELGLGCGTSPDGCGITLSCGNCNTPPASECLSPIVLRSFSVGTCVSGQCTFSTQDQTCPFGCKGDACNPCVPHGCLANACGHPSDGCGGAFSCGVCDLPQTCGGAGTPFQCGSGSWDVALVVDAGALGPSLAGSSDSDVWVGYGNSVLHWDGVGWTSILPPVWLSSIFAFAPNQAIAAGGPSAQEYVWDGQFWNLGGAYGEFGPAHIWGPNINESFIVTPMGVINWCVNNTEPPCNVFGTLGGGPGWNWVWGTSGDDVWTVGGPNAWHFSAGSWNVTNPPTSAQDNLTGVGGWGDDVWVTDVGGRMLHFRHSTGAWDSTTLGTADLAGVWANAPDDVWAVGGGSAFHWNGAAWQQDVRVSGAGLQAVWGPDAGSIWILDLQTLYHLTP